jgi:hypothetical protein
MKSDLKIILGVVVILLLAEISLRLFSDLLSLNIKHIRSIPSSVAQLRQEKRTMVFLGNSLINNAINQNLFSDQLKINNCSDVFLVKITPDDTSLWDWYYIYKHNLIIPHCPDLLIVGFAGPHLSDQLKPVPRRLAGFFCTFEDLPELIGFGMKSTTDILDFIVGSISQIYVNREVIRNRILDPFIYKYRESTQYINGLIRAINVKESKNPRSTYKLLQAFIHLAKERNTMLVFIAMPVVNLYTIDPALIQLLRSNNVVFSDYRAAPFIKKDMFLDSMHLDEAGRDVFSKNLADSPVLLDSLCNK